jgi:hypothetical protein
MGNLGNVFDKRMNQLGLKKQVDASMVVEETQAKIDKIFGDRGRENLKVTSFKDGVIKIAASSNVWAAECQNRFVNKDPKISKIKFFITNLDKENY